jgi:hypothetical protein
MCRNIRPLFNFDPPTTQEEIHDAALQYVRKVSGSVRPSQSNQKAFDHAVEVITVATEKLVAGLVTTAPPKNRDIERQKARERSVRRFGAR